MLGFFGRQFGLLHAALVSGDTPRQLALGFALGMAMGLIPKGNLIALVISALMLGTRANVSTGMLSASAFTMAAMFIDPLTHHVGLALLSSQLLRPFWVDLYSLPLVPWTSLNNTVVLGSSLLAAGLFYPAYRYSIPIFARLLVFVEGKKGSGDSTETSTAASETTLQSTTSFIQNALSRIEST